MSNYIRSLVYFSFFYTQILYSYAFRSSFFFIRRTFGESKLTFKKVERNARRYKITHPPLPKEATGIVKAFSTKSIMDKYGLNLRKTKKLYIDTVIRGTDFFTVFASHQVIELIEKFIPATDRRYLLDGTFKVVPIKKYYQLLILHIEFQGDVSLNFNIFILFFSRFARLT